MSPDAGLPDELPSSEFIVYTAADEKTRVQLRTVDGSVWLTQRQISDLFDKSQSTVSEHIRNIYSEGECSSGATYRKFRSVQIEGGREVVREIEAYNLDVILAVGYRTRSARAAQFRRWASTVLSEYLIKGFAMDDRRLKSPTGADYFDELLERIRDIRASEKRFYQKVKDVFMTASADYDSSSPLARDFFATVQNKVTYAVTGKTAAELICERADASKDNMGLTSWDKHRVLKGDVRVAKNYLNEDESKQLNRLSNMFMDAAEDRAERRTEMKMADWVKFTDKFLMFNDRDVLQGYGRVTRAAGEAHAVGEYAKYDLARKELQRIEAENDHLQELERLEKQVQAPDGLAD